MISDHQVRVKVRKRLTKLLHHKQSKKYFIPLAHIQELRDLTRYHQALIQERTHHINQLQEVLATAKLHHPSAVNHTSSNRQRKSASTLTAGEANSQHLTELAYVHNRAKLLDLCQNLEEHIPAHQRFLISTIISHVDFLEGRIKNVQRSINAYISSYDKNDNIIDISSSSDQSKNDSTSSNINADIERLVYYRHIVPWTEVYPGNRQSKDKSISTTTRQQIILYELAQVIAPDKDTFPALFYHQADSMTIKRAIVNSTHKLLTISYHILKNNKSDQKSALSYNMQLALSLLPSEQPHGYRFGPLVINCCFSICLMAGLALISHSPFVFPSLGPTVFLFFYKPTDPSSSPRNILIGHAIATIVGYLSLVVTGLTAAGPAFAVGVTLPRIIAIGLSLGLTVGLMIRLRAPHPPATATTLIISLGTLTKPWQLLVLMLAIVILTVQALIINRLAGIDYPLWRPQPVRTALSQRY